MTDRCEPPEHLRGVSGWHWIQAPSERDPHPEWWKADMGWRGCREGIGAHWRYLAPVPSPEAVARLVEAGRRMSECDLGLIPEEGCTCETCEAWHALRDALAAFPEDKT